MIVDAFDSRPVQPSGKKLRRNPRDQSLQHSKPGWVYLISLPDEWQVPLYKIGLSKNPIRRASQISKEWSGWTVMIAACFKTDNMARDEEFLMEAFEEYQLNGGYEYFKLGAEELTRFILLARELARDAGYRMSEEGTQVMK